MVVVLCFVLCVFSCHVPLCMVCMIHIVVPRLPPCVCVCALPALLLNNPAYHLLLSDHRKGSRPLVVPSTTQAQEKSLNVPQGKRPQTGPAQSRGAPTTLPNYPGLGAVEVLSQSSLKKCFQYIMSLFCMFLTFIIPPVTHIISHSHPLITQNNSCFVWRDSLGFWGTVHFHNYPECVTLNLIHVFFCL